MIKIALIHPSARPTAWKAARDRYLTAASGKTAIGHFLVCDERHEAAFREYRVQDNFEAGHFMVNRGRQDVTTATNLAVAEALPWADLLVGLADDLECPNEWDELLCRRIPDMASPYVLHVSSGLKNNDEALLITQPICTAAYARLDPWFLHPDFSSMWNDNLWSLMAYSRGCVIRCRDLLFRHLHYSVGLREKDAVDQEHDNGTRYAEGKATFERLVKIWAAMGENGRWPEPEGKTS